MKNIKIFVSHRIDIESFQVPNQLFVNILCGAFRPHKDIGLIGDNTGDNISELQSYFSELTVQYWAWKNQEADYYGLCHYRRYLSFTKKTFPSYPTKFVPEYSLNKLTARKYGLLDFDNIYKFTTSYDCIAAEPSPVKKWIVPHSNYIPENTRDLWIKFGNVYEKDIVLLEKIILEKNPDYSNACKTYFNADSYTGFN